MECIPAGYHQDRDLCVSLAVLDDAGIIAFPVSRVWRCLGSQQTTNGIVAMSRDKTQP